MVLRYLVIGLTLLFPLCVEARDQRIVQELADRTPPVNPLREALGAKSYEEAMASGKYRYIGPRKCRVCHRDFYNGRRRNDLHHSAFKPLRETGYATESRCLGCHTTGYGVPAGGYRNEKLTPELSGVDCEGCHGPGNVHMRLNDGGGFLAGVDHPERLERMCKACHNARWNKSFSAKEFRKIYDSYVTAKPGDKKPYYNY